MSASRGTAPTGFTLMELMIALVVLSSIMGATLSVFRSQTSSFREASEQLELYQNARYAVGTVDRVLRTAGAGVVNQQPMFLYGDGDVVAFNTNYTSALPDNCAVNVNVDAPPGSHDMLTLAQASVLPNTAWVYPAANYPPGTCRAETIVFYFRPDSTTADATDFVLLQRINVQPPELVARNLFAYPNRPFFEYFVHPRTLAVPPASRDSLIQANLPGSGIALPIVHRAPVHGSPTDSVGDPSASYLADSVKAVRVNVRVSNGRQGARRRIRDLSTVVGLPNNGLVQVKACGTAPLLTGPLTVTPNVVGTPPSVTLRWNASIDEAAGESDVSQYNIYRRRAAEPAFGSALITIPAGQPPPYVFTDNGVTLGEIYFYGVAAQDCTPLESPLVTNAAPVGPN